jgi:hypothetical protein
MILLFLVSLQSTNIGNWANLFRTEIRPNPMENLIYSNYLNKIDDTIIKGDCSN